MYPGVPRLITKHHSLLDETSICAPIFRRFRSEPLRAEASGAPGHIKNHKTSVAIAGRGVYFGVS